MALRKKRKAKAPESMGRSAPAYLKRCRAIVEHAPEILALLGPSGEIVYVNPQMERVLGYRLEEVRGRNIFAFVHPEDVPRAAHEFTETVQIEGERVPSVLRLRDKPGGWIPFEIIASNRLKDREVEAVVFTARDLRFRKEIEVAIRRANADTEQELARRSTELAKSNAELRIENQARRQAEARLQQTVSLLNATLDSTADGILVVSNEGKVTSCNQKFVEMWRLGCVASAGADDEDFLAVVVDQLLDPGAFLDKVRALYSEPAATSFDVIHFKDGRIFERYSQPQRINDTITGRVWSFRDVTRARNLEQELRQSQKMEALGRLAGGIAHDFNNLLMLIAGYVTQLMENPALEAGSATYEQMLATTRRAAAVIKQLLAFARKQADTPTLTDLNVTVLDLEQMLRRLLSDQIQLDVSLAIDPQPVFIDVSQMEMLIMNLAVNAQDAMPEGGRLSISTGSRPFVSREHGEERTCTYTVLEVTDTGHGMPPEVKERIFEPFFTTKQLGRGTGMGLSTAQSIVERAGGRIEVESEPKRGTTFRVFIPQVDAAPAEPAIPRISALPAGGNETILLAEDEAGIRAMTRAYLEGLGYRVLEAADGTEALRVSLEYAGVIDLVLSDVLMPGMRGDSAVAEIRKQRPGIKAIYISGYSDPVAEGDTDSLLYKPFEFPELGRQLRLVLDTSTSVAPERDAAAD